MMAYATHERKHPYAGRVAYWSPGAQARGGDPFALACHQPFVDMQQAIARMSGAREESRLWDTWDGMHIGEPDRQVSLGQVVRQENGQSV